MKWIKYIELQFSAAAYSTKALYYRLRNQKERYAMASILARITRILAKKTRKGEE